MTSDRVSGKGRAAASVALALVCAVTGGLDAQRGDNRPLVPLPPRAAAPIDLTGYWVSIVTQDWRWRMVTPAKGDYLGIPMTVEAKKVADQWDPARDEAAGEQCKSYGAAALMGVPGRLHITWQDDNTLRIDADAGIQTRLFHFGGWQPPREAPRSWQGQSRAEWQTPNPNPQLYLRPAARSAADPPPPQVMNGSLKVVTTNLRAGYLRKNGVPYSANAALTEYWDLTKQPNGALWLTITTQVEDQLYLREPRQIAFLFKKEADSAKWDPTPCSARW